MKKTEKATTTFQNGYNCAQSVFSVFAPETGISENDSLKIACAFGGGMGKQQLTCGAVTGALMVLGLKYGKGIEDSDNKKVDTYKKTKEFCNEFIKINGSINCKELLDGLDMNKPEEYEKIIQQDLFRNRCEKYISDAVKILEKMIN